MDLLYHSMRSVNVSDRHSQSVVSRLFQCQCVFWFDTLKGCLVSHQAQCSDTLTH